MTQVCILRLDVPSRSHTRYNLPDVLDYPSSSLQISARVSCGRSPVQPCFDPYHVDIEDGYAGGIVILVKHPLKLVVEEPGALLKSKTTRRIKRATLWLVSYDLTKKKSGETDLELNSISAALLCYQPEKRANTSRME